MVTGEVLWVELTAAGAWWDNSFLNKIIAHIHQNILTLSPFFSYRFLQFQGNQNVLVRLVLIQPLSGWQQQRCCVRERVRYNINIHQTDTTYQLHFVALTIFSSPTALTAISGRSKSVGMVWEAGAAVRLTAAAVPSHRTRGFERRRLRRRRVMARTWWLLRWCGRSGRWAEMRVEGSRCFQRWNRWRGGDMADMVVVGAFLSWWNENNAVCTKIKQEGRERENDLNFYLRKIWRHRWIQIVCNEKMWDYQQ